MTCRLLLRIATSFKLLSNKSGLVFCSLVLLSACTQHIYPPLSATDLANSLNISPNTITFHPTYCEYAEVPTSTQEAIFKQCIYSQTDKEIIVAEQAAYKYFQWNNQQHSASNALELSFNDIHSVGISKRPFHAAQLHLVRKGEVGKSMLVINFLDNQLVREDNPNKINSVHALIQAHGIADAQYDLAYVDYLRPINYQSLTPDNSSADLAALLRSINKERDRTEWQKREDFEKQVAEDTRIFNEGQRLGADYSYNRELKMFIPSPITNIEPVPQYTPPPAWQNNLRLPR